MDSSFLSDTATRARFNTSLQSVFATFLRLPLEQVRRGGTCA